MPATLFSPLVDAAQRVTSPPFHHFFGYYDKSPWDASGRWLLALRTEFMNRPPSEHDAAEIGVIDTLENNRWTPLASTQAWNWQQGCMLQWLGDGRSGEIIFNSRSDDRFVARILDIHTGRERILPQPVYVVNRIGTAAISINFARLHHQRPGYGYPGIPDCWKSIPEPRDDGLHFMDLGTGKSNLILNIKEVADFQRCPESENKFHRFNHVQFGANPSRFAFLHRYKTPREEVGTTRLLTVNTDGSELHCLSDHGMVSHYDWRGGNSILAWARRKGSGDHYYLFHDQGGSPEIMGERVLDCDGHCSFSPNQEWVLTDTYPDATDHRTLLLYHYASGQRINLGKFHAPPMDWQVRCDLHPRWSRDGQRICFDSVHEGTRQMYVMDVARVVSSPLW